MVYFISGRGSLKASLFNGSDYPIKNVSLVVNFYAKGKYDLISLSATEPMPLIDAKSSIIVISFFSTLAIVPL